MPNIYSENLLRRIAPLRLEIINHPLYSEIGDVPQVAEFMRYHVFAVWDFMSLLKALQRRLTCTGVPWFPVGDAETRFLINQIVTGEESDLDENGQRTSHFELYLKAMSQIGADPGEIKRFVQLARQAPDIRAMIAASDIPPAAKDFIGYTFELIAEDKAHVLASVFTFGREDLIPGMFLALVSDLERRFPDKISILRYYLHRHIEVDGDEHGQLALAMTAKLCGADEEKWLEAETAVIRALELRVRLWNGVLSSIRGSGGDKANGLFAKTLS